MKKEDKHIYAIQRMIDWGRAHDDNFKVENISDGYHTFKELYDFRASLQAALFNEWAKTNHLPPNHQEPRYDVHKSMRHHDGIKCFDGSWFIVSAILPTGQISNHYPMELWDLFQIPEHKKCKHAWDGHIASDVLWRINSLYKKDK